MIESIRLNKFISDSGICSRREADRYIEHGHVFVNGKRATVGMTVSSKDKVLCNGHRVEPKSEEELVLMAFNKPVGIVSTTEIGVRDSIVDYIGFHERIFPIGRLDKDSQGLIFLTNNGDIVNKILRAGNKHEKEYVVTVNKPLTDDFIKKMSSGVPILGEVTKKCDVSKESAYIFRITLIQGLNRQIRRMCEYFGYEVIRLERVRIMNITLKNLPVGEWRLLESAEIQQIMNALANSVSEAKTVHRQLKPSVGKHASKTPEHQPSKPKHTSKSDSTRYNNPKSKELRSEGKHKAKSKYGEKSSSRSHSQPRARRS